LTTTLLATLATRCSFGRRTGSGLAVCRLVCGAVAKTRSGA
jgi:hypothetical protein